MKPSKNWGMVFAGAAAGLINGMFGAGGGMVLVPLLGMLTSAKEEQVFPASVSIIMPVCAVSLAIRATEGSLDFTQALPYLIGGVIGGFAAGLIDGKIPTKWLHRILGLMIIWGGVRYLC